MKFSIRDLFLVTMIVALALGWWVDHRNTNARLADILWELDYQKLVHRNKEEGWKEVLASLRARGISLTTRGVPSSQAPAPNPPKP